MDDFKKTIVRDYLTHARRQGGVYSDDPVASQRTPDLKRPRLVPGLPGQQYMQAGRQAGVLWSRTVLVPYSKLSITYARTPGAEGGELLAT